MTWSSRAPRVLRGSFQLLRGPSAPTPVPPWSFKLLGPRIGQPIQMANLVPPVCSKNNKAAGIARTGTTTSMNAIWKMAARATAVYLGTKPTFSLVEALAGNSECSSCCNYPVGLSPPPAIICGTATKTSTITILSTCHHTKTGTNYNNLCPKLCMRMGLGCRGNTGGPLGMSPGDATMDGSTPLGKVALKIRAPANWYPPPLWFYPPSVARKLRVQLENLETLLKMAQAGITCYSPLVTSPRLDRRVIEL